MQLIFEHKKLVPFLQFKLQAQKGCAFVLNPYLHHNKLAQKYEIYT